MRNKTSETLTNLKSAQTTSNEPENPNITNPILHILNFQNKQKKLIKDDKPS